MGMYSTMEETDIKLLKPLPKTFFKTDDRLDEDTIKWLTGENSDCIRFFGYWTDEVMEALHRLGSKGYLSGECQFEYEEGDIIKCRFDKSGFSYSIGRIIFDEWRSDYEE